MAAYASTADAKNPVDTSNVELFGAAQAGAKIGIVFLYATNRGTTDVNLLIKDGTTTRWTIAMKAGAAFSFMGDARKPYLIPLGNVTVATAVNVALSATGDVLVSAESTTIGATPT